MTGRSWRRLIGIWCGALMVCAVFVPSGAHADVKLVSSIVSTSSTGISGGTVQSITYLKGPWLRREAAGEGRIASILADKIVILNRVTGERISLYVDSKVYRMDTVPDVNCGPEWVADMRMLGRSQSPSPASVSFPDSTIEVLGHPAQLVQIALAPPGMPDQPGTLLRFWMTSDYAKVFGDGYRKDLFCGDDGEGTSNRDDIAAAWKKQFSLSDAATDSVRARVKGYPLKMEILAGNQGGIKTSTVIQVSSIDEAPLPDSLFQPPSNYKPYEGKAEELWKEMKTGQAKQSGEKK